jgi:hypothetical protein
VAAGYEVVEEAPQCLIFSLPPESRWTTALAKISAGFLLEGVDGDVAHDPGEGVEHSLIR